MNKLDRVGSLFNGHFLKLLYRALENNERGDVRFEKAVDMCAGTINRSVEYQVKKNVVFLLVYKQVT